MYLFEESLFFLLWEIVAIPLGKAGPAVATDEKKAVDHFWILL